MKNIYEAARVLHFAEYLLSRRVLVFFGSSSSFTNCHPRFIVCFCFPFLPLLFLPAVRSFLIFLLLFMLVWAGACSVWMFVLGILVLIHLFWWWSLLTNILHILIPCDGWRCDWVVTEHLSSMCSHGEIAIMRWAAGKGEGNTRFVVVCRYVLVLHPVLLLGWTAFQIIGIQESTWAFSTLDCTT